jgi:hypothetical protein
LNTRTALVIAVIACVIISSPSAFGLIAQRMIATSGVMASVVPPDSMLHVQGNKIYAGTQEVHLTGFKVFEPNVLGGSEPLTPAGLQQIKAWGFNTVMVSFWWSHDIEPYEDLTTAPFRYNADNLQKIDTFIQNAADAGLYVVLGLRITHGGEWFQGWVTIDQFESDPTVRQRFYECWAMMLDRYDDYENLAGYLWWVYPWHEAPWGARDPVEVDLYYNDVIPHLLSLTRMRSEKIIFHTAYRQGDVYVDGDLLPTGEFTWMQPLADNNVVYCIGWHGPRDNGDNPYVEWGTYDWDYDVALLTHELQIGYDWATTHNVPIMITEIGLLFNDSTRPLTQSRLDCYDAKMRLLKQYGWHWVYWAFCWNNGEMEGVLHYGTLDPFPIVDVLRANNY